MTTEMNGRHNRTRLKRSPHSSEGLEASVTESKKSLALDARDAVKMARKKERLDELSAALLHATYLSIPREYRRRWKGNTCIDATFISAFGKRGTRKDKSRIGIEYDAGWYFRDGNHSAADAAKGDNGRFGWEIHLVTMVANAYRVEAEFPLLILGASTDKPSGRIAENALTAYTHMKTQFDARGDDALPGGYAMGDRAYFSGTMATSLQIPLRQMGFGLLMDYKSDQLGMQTADVSGAILVDGSWYCPDMPQPLVDATADYRAGNIDREVHQARMKERDRYLAVRKSGPDEQGYGRWMHPTVKNGHVCDAARSGAPRFCTQKSVTISPIAGGKFAQDLPHDSIDWKQLYNTGRNTIEGWNAILKDDGHFQIDSSGRRRVRGRTAAHFSVILLIVAANMAKVGKFMDLQDDKLRAPAIQARKSRRPKRVWDWSKNMHVDVPALASSPSVRC